MSEINDKKIEDIAIFLSVFSEEKYILSLYTEGLDHLTKEELINDIGERIQWVRILIKDSIKSAQLLSIWQFEICNYLVKLISISHKVSILSSKEISELEKSSLVSLSDAKEFIFNINNWTINQFTTLLLYVMHELAKIQLEQKLSIPAKGFYLNIKNANPVERQIKVEEFINELINKQFVNQDYKSSLEMLFAGGDIHERVDWNTNINELGFLFDQMRDEEKELLVKSGDVNHIWQRLADCFTVKGKLKTAKMFSQNHNPKNKSVRTILLSIINNLTEPPRRPSK